MHFICGNSSTGSELEYLFQNCVEQLILLFEHSPASFEMNINGFWVNI